jgi:hypothetical protein
MKRNHLDSINNNSAQQNQIKASWAIYMLTCWSGDDNIGNNVSESTTTTTATRTLPDTTMIYVSSTNSSNTTSRRHRRMTTFPQRIIRKTAGWGGSFFRRGTIDVQTVNATDFFLGATKYDDDDDGTTGRTVSVDNSSSSLHSGVTPTLTSLSFSDGSSSTSSSGGGSNSSSSGGLDDSEHRRATCCVDDFVHDDDDDDSYRQLSLAMVVCW